MCFAAGTPGAVEAVRNTRWPAGALIPRPEGRPSLGAIARWPRPRDASHLLMRDAKQEAGTMPTWIKAKARREGSIYQPRQHLSHSS
jgi:hypothetical protein